jgi:hypothetical protein
MHGHDSEFNIERHQKKVCLEGKYFNRLPCGMLRILTIRRRRKTWKRFAEIRIVLPALQSHLSTILLECMSAQYPTYRKLKTSLLSDV